QASAIARRPTLRRDVQLSTTASPNAPKVIAPRLISIPHNYAEPFLHGSGFFLKLDRSASRATPPQSLPYRSALHFSCWLCGGVGSTGSRPPSFDGQGH